MQLSEGRDQLNDFRLRLILALTVVLGLSLLLGLRLWHLQAVEYGYFAKRADKNRSLEVPVPGVRGLIYDRNGAVLADNIPSWQLDLIPEQIDDLQKTLDEISQVIPIQTHERQRFMGRLKSNKPFYPVPLKFSLSPEELARMEVSRGRWPGVYVQAALTRRYSRGADTAHLVGYVGGISARELAGDAQGDYRGATHIGKTGIEKAYETELRPIAGSRTVESDAQGRRLGELDYSAPTPGWDLHLTIDLELQSATKAALKGRKGAAVVLDVRNGDVLALVSVPSFDPHLFVDGISHTNYARLTEHPGNPLFNRAIQGRYPPGSTVKPLVAMAGLEYGLRRQQSKTYCRGYYQLPEKERKYRDWKRRGHGAVHLQGAIAQSCDVYFYELAHAMGIDRLASFGALFGIGARTGIALPAEDGGVLPSREWKYAARGEHWYPGETLNIGIGQGYMLMTPLQLAVMTARVATRGQGFAPRLLRTRTRGSDAVAEDPRPLPVVSLKKEAHWQQIHDAMIAVVHGASGTARKVAEGLPFKVAGKTGTAQVAGLSQEDDEAPQLEDVPEKLRDHALFISWAPATAPEIAVAVIVENSGSGSAVAAPIAKTMLKNWLLRCNGLAWRPWCLEADI